MLIPEITQYIEIKRIKTRRNNNSYSSKWLYRNSNWKHKKLAKNHKHIAIITKNISKMKNIEEQILEETGAIITVMNNKKKSSKSKNSNKHWLSNRTIKTIHTLWRKHNYRLNAKHKIVKKI